MFDKKIKTNIKIYDNYIEITPEEGMKDNSIYKINLKNVYSVNGDEYNGEEIIKITTEMTPLFCNIIDVNSLLNIDNIDEEIILYHIREASKYAEYVYEKVFKNKTINKNKIPIAIKEFTRYKAAKECLLKIYMSLVTDNVVEGKLGDVTFKLRDQLPDIKKLLDYLDSEILKWLDAIQGYDLEGRAMMKTAIRGYNHGRINPMTNYEKYTTPKRVPIGLNRGVY